VTLSIVDDGADGVKICGERTSLAASALCAAPKMANIAGHVVAFISLLADGGTILPLIYPMAFWYTESGIESLTLTIQR
jgi:hypothetical protein